MKTLKMIFGGIIIFAIVMTIYDANFKSPSKTIVTPQAAQKQEPTLREQVTVKKMNWRLDGFGGVLVAGVTIENKSNLSLKDFILRCVTKGGSGSELSEVTKTIYESIAAGKTKSFSDVNMGFVSSQSKKAACEIIGALPQDYK